MVPEPRPESAAHSPTRTGAPWIPLLLILAGAYFLYAPATGFPFVYDDVFQIAQNPHLDSWRYLPLYFTQHVWSHVPQIAPNFYRPVFLLWLRLNNLAFDHEPAGWHFTTIFLHLSVTWLAYLLALALLRNRPAAMVTALIFALHPIHVEAVAWVSGLPEPLSSVFLLGSFLCYLRMRNNAGRQVLWLTASLLLFFLALLGKETAAVLPLLILAYEMTMGSKRDSVPAAEKSGEWFVRWLILPYGLTLASYLLARAVVLGTLTHRMTSVPLATSLLSWPAVLIFYCKLLLWPAGLSPLYDQTYASHLISVAFLLPTGVILAFGAGLVWLSRRSKSGIPPFLAGWFLLTLAPALLIFCVALPAEGFHDRYLYLPSLAAALAGGAIFGTIWEQAKWPTRMLATLAAGIVTVAMILGTHAQIRYWASNYDLFQRAVTIAPLNEVANLNFASELLSRREYDRALALSQRMAELYPSSARARASAAAAASFLGRYELAAGYYESAVRLDPSQALLFQFLGLTRMKLGRYSEARDALRQAAMIDPAQPAVHYGLGLVDERLGLLQEARREFEIELKANPDDGNSQKELLDVSRRLEGCASNASVISAKARAVSCQKQVPLR